MKQKLSINDIAKTLNVSKTTISFILNGKAKEKRISESLTKKVLDYIEANDYKPNQLAKSLSTGKTRTIGLMVEKISDPFFAQIAYHIEELADKKGYKIIYCSTENSTKKTKELIKLFTERQVDGFIITPPVGIEQEIQSILQDNIPIVLFDRYYETIETSYVTTSNYSSTYESIKYLISKNYKNIAFVELDSEQSQMRDRRNGYSTAIEEHLLFPNITRIPFSSDKQQITSKIITLLTDNKQIDAIFFATNYLAMAGIKAIQDMGLNIPGDIAIISFDDHDVFDIYNPPITAVAQPIKEMANQLINVLLADMEVEKKIARKIVVPANLIIRGSTIF